MEKKPTIATKLVFLLSFAVASLFLLVFKLRRQPTKGGQQI